MLTNWIIALKLLIRYKLRYNPFICIGSGEITRYECNLTGKHLKSIVRVNPFDPDFMETFLHEVGHHVYKKPMIINPSQNRIKDTLFGYNMFYKGKGLECALEEEIFASKFAYKASKKLKVQCSKAKLLQWFYTYTGAGYKYLSRMGLDRTKYTSHVQRLINKLERA